VKRWIWIVFAAFWASVCLSGCAPELHQRLLVKAVGIDLDTNGYCVTICAAKTDGSGGEMSYSSTGETVPQALESIALETGKKPLYAHTAVLVFGMDCAERGIEDCLDFFLRHYDSKPTVKLCVAETSAKEVLMIPDAEAPTVRAQRIADAMQAVHFTGGAAEADLIDLINHSMGKRCGTVLPVIKAEESPVISGAILLQEMRAEKPLNASALRGYLLLSGKLHAGETPVRTEQYGTISVSVTKSKCQLSFSGTKEEPAFTVQLRVKGEISALAKGLLRLDSAAFPVLEQAYAEELLHDAEAYIRTAVQNGTDAVGLMDVMRRALPDDWDDTAAPYEYLKQAVFDVQITAEIDRVEEEDTPYL